MQEKKLLALVAAINATLDIDEMRRVTLKMLRELIWFDGASFWLADPLTGLPEQSPVLLDTPAESIVPYLTYYIHIDEVTAALRAGESAVARSTDLVDYGVWTRKSEYYNDFLRTYNTHYLMGCELKEGQTVYAMLCLRREKSTGDFRPEDLGLLHLLYLHLLNRLRWHYAVTATRRQSRRRRLAASPSRTRFTCLPRGKKTLCGW
ncbi:MAG: hypothetical protein AB1374_09065 [Bacillota bacterium]